MSLVMTWVRQSEADFQRSRIKITKEYNKCKKVTTNCLGTVFFLLCKNEKSTKKADDYFSFNMTFKYLFIQMPEE